jgi:hypothetical protein
MDTPPSSRNVDHADVYLTSPHGAGGWGGGTANFQILDMFTALAKFNKLKD